MKKCLIVALLIIVQVNAINAQRQLALSDVIELARMQSVDAAVALNELKTAYWEYRTHQADMLPEVNFIGTLPSYNKSYSSYQQSDGSYTFVRNNSLGLSSKLAIDQNIWMTGGKLSLTFSLDYLQQLSVVGQDNCSTITYLLTAVMVVLGVWYPSKVASNILPV